MRIEVGSERTDYAQVFANPSGTFTVEQASRPQRTKVNGKWTAIDTTLHFTPDGAVKPAATTVGVTLSGGKTGQPLAELNRSGRKLAFSWDVPLPVPTLSGPTATYANVLPDVDLVVTADVDSFSEVLVVKTRAAGDNPKLKALALQTSATGVTVGINADGTLHAEDESGQTFFAGSQPRMWDSKAEPGREAANVTERHVRCHQRGRRADGRNHADAGQSHRRWAGPGPHPCPGPGHAHRAGHGLPGRHRPHPRGNQQAWAIAYKPYPNTPYWNGLGFHELDGTANTTLARVGHETTTGGTARSFFRMNTSNLWGATVTRSWFSLKATHSWSCTAEPITIYDTPGIDASLTWNISKDWFTTARKVSVAKNGQGGGVPALLARSNGTPPARCRPPYSTSGRTGRSG
ncbi:hypothetical protein ACU686_13400 [Yinghuangia aomiensis]